MAHAVLTLLWLPALWTQEDADAPRRQWKVIASPAATDFRAVFFLNSKSGWAIGADGTVVATPDGGSSWSKIRTGESEKRLFAVYQHLFFTDERTGWIGANEAACALAGPILRSVWSTVDGGTSWQRVEKPPPDINRRLVVSPEFTTAAGEEWSGWDGSVYVGRKGEGGRIASMHSSLVNHAEIDNPSFRDVSFCSPVAGCLVGYDKRGGLVAVTEGGGRTWRRVGVETFKDRRPGGVWMSTPQEIRIVAGNAIFATANAGKTWTQEWEGKPGQELNALSFPTPSTGIAVGKDGLLLRNSR